MPGLVGAIDHTGRRPVGKILSRMVAAMRHKDWYQVDCFDHDGLVALGRVSLGIFNSEKQPAVDSGRQIAVFLDGELSNRDELREQLVVGEIDRVVSRQLLAIGLPFPTARETRGGLPPLAMRVAQPASDADLALGAYLRWGQEFADELQGSFAVMVWDGARRELVVANDRFGLRPLYYAQNRGSLLLGSEGKAILADPDFPRKPDYDGIACLLSMNHLLGDNTLFDGIRLLPPASILTYRDGQLRLRRYWLPQNYLLAPEDRKTIGEGEYLDLVRYCFNRAVERDTAGPARVGLFLTGGLDSRTILSAIPADREAPCLTFFGVPGSSDQLVGKEAAAIAGRPHFSHDFGPEALENFAAESIKVSEGMLPATQCHGLAPIEWAKTHAAVILSGWGGEFARAPDVGGGRLLTRLPRYAFDVNDHEKMKSHRFNGLAKSFKESELKDLLTPDCYRAIAGRARQCLARALAVTEAFPSAWDRSDYFDLWEHARRMNLFGLVFLNTAIEHRAPFADYQFVDTLTSAPHALHRQAPYAVIHRYILKKNHPGLAKLRDVNSGVPAGAGIPHRALRGMANGWLAKRPLSRLPIPRHRAKSYVDYDAWMRNEVKDYVLGLLLDKRSLERGYFRESYVRALVDNHMSGGIYAANKLGVLLGFELWHRLFLD